MRSNASTFLKRHLSISIVTMLGLTTAWLAEAQNLFVAEPAGGNDIYEIGPSGTPVTYFGFAGDTGGMAFNNAGDLFVSDELGSIYEFAPDGTKSLFVTGLNAPWGVAVNNAGELFAADYGSGDIYEFSPDGTQSIFASGLSEPQALAFNSAGDLFVATSATLYEYTPSGMRSVIATSIFANSLAFDSAGDLFGGSVGGVWEITSGGVLSTFSTEAGATGLAFNSAGDLFVTDFARAKIIEFAPDGTESTFVSGIYEPYVLAFQPVPEPPGWFILGMGTLAALGLRLKPCA